MSYLIGFTFDENGRVILEQDLWKFLGEHLGKNSMFDACMPKPHGEVLVYGNYYAANGEPVTADRIQLSIGRVEKEIAIIGDRYWQPLIGASEPEPLTELALDYCFAFGGKDYALNPTGKGIDEVEVRGEMRVPLPNIENPNALITSPSQRVEPIGLSPLDMMWQYRTSKLGTYDEQWQRDYFPGYAADMDWTHFNTAPQDQWLDEYWQGDEDFYITNMHKQKIQVQGQLPGFRSRCFIERKIDNETQFTEVDMRAETVCLFPNQQTGVMIYRGNIEITEDDGSDVLHLLAAFEDISQAQRSVSHYAEALKNRLDEEQTMKYMMYSRDLIAESEVCGFAQMLGEEQPTESEFSKNIATLVEDSKQDMQVALDEKKQLLKKQLEELGIDPSLYLEKMDVNTQQEIDDPYVIKIMESMDKILPGASTGDMSKIDVREVDFREFDNLSRLMQEMAEAKKQEAKEKIKSLLNDNPQTEIDEDINRQITESLKSFDELPMLPRIESDVVKLFQQQLKKIENIHKELAQQGIEKEKWPKLPENLEGMSDDMASSLTNAQDLYRQGAHYIEGRPPHKEPLDIIQYRLEKALKKGKSLKNSDWSGVDFSGLDLSGQDFSGCYLEYTDFSNAILLGANFSCAILSHSDLSYANLSGCNFYQANIGSANLQHSVFDKSNLSEAILSLSDLTDASLKNCDLSDVMFLEAKMQRVDFSSSTFTQTNFLEQDFTGANFHACKISEANFLQCQLRNVNFSKADLCSSNFVECDLSQSEFIQANMENVRFPSACLLNECDFTGANISKSNFRDVEAVSSNFEHCICNQADFSGANLHKAKFYGAEGKRALFMKSDLSLADFSSVNAMEASMLGARLTSANLQYSNLYAVEFMNVTLGETNFYGANLDMSKLQDWRPDV